MVDAYRMFQIWRLKRISRRLLKESGRPPCGAFSSLLDTTNSFGFD
jgi:hypothetical protein